jgi:PGF-CTERM protein
MTDNKTYRSVGLAALVVLAAVVGSVAAVGTVAAQDAGENGTNESASAEDFYSPSDEEPLNVRFRDGAANTVESVAEGVLNLNIVYGLFDGPYDVEITAPGLSDEQVDGITFDSEEYDTEGLDRTEIVGMNFSGVPAGEYEFTVSVVDGDAEQTVPLEVTGDESDAANVTANETANETTDAANETTETAANESANATTTAEAATETEMGNGTGTAMDANTTVTAVPSAPNTSANHTVSTVVGANATGNLSELTINYGESNTTIGLVGGSIFSASLGGESVINNTTAPTIGAEGRNLTIGFDGTVTVSEGDRLNISYGGVTNPTEAGSYTVGITLNNGSARNATLEVTESTAPATTTAGGGAAGTATTSAETTDGAAGGETAAGTAGAAGGAETNASGQGTEAGGPGFGIAVAVIALLGAALLATRRS